MDVPEKLEELGRQGYKAADERIRFRTEEKNYSEEGFFKSKAGRNESRLEFAREFPASDTVFVAPHGGHIEPYTGRQAYTASEEASASAWIFGGFRKDWETSFEEMHVPSHRIDPSENEYLESLLDGDHEESVSFHCFRDSGVESDIILGGQGSELKQELKDQLASDYDVSVADSRHDRYHGLSDSNIVNTLSDQGVQIEQDWEVLREDWRDIAEKAARTV
ncbi:MAG: poly-gamma-glutamate hydrolase family protein [Candidatus Nanohalobium sp.]